MKAAFDLKRQSGYDDQLPDRYHFPDNVSYRDVADACRGDWVVFREPRRHGGRTAYFAVAIVVAIEHDLRQPGMWYARLRSFLQFPNPVPLKRRGDYFETRLRNVARSSQVGESLQGKSIRELPDSDFDEIFTAGFAGVAPTSQTWAAKSDSEDYAPPPPNRYDAPGFSEEAPRRVDQILLNRTFRDAAFRHLVCEAYDRRCAVTGLRIINGGGRAEVQAAHIKPVADDGPDVVQNGIALCATVHWLFDRHLISIDDQYRLLVAHNRVPLQLAQLFRPRHEQLYLPKDKGLWPSAAYLAHHRNVFAEGMT